VLRRRHVGDQNLLAQVIFHDRGYVGVHDFVVGDAGARSVGDRQTPGAVDVHQPGDAEHRIGPESFRVEKVVVDPPVNHVDPFESLGRAHPREPFRHHQVASFDELNAHLLGEEGVLEVGRVVNPRRQHHHARCFDVRRRERFQQIAQPARIIVDRTNARRFEDLRKGALHDDAVLEDVGHAGRAAQVVFEHVDLAVAVADQIRAGDVTPHAIGRVEADALLPEAAGGVDDRGGHDAVSHDLLAVIDVVDEQVQRADPLFEAKLDPCPFGGRHDPRNEVEGKNPLGAGAVAVDVEGDPHVQQRPLGRALAAQQLAVGHRVDQLDQRPGSGSRRAIRIEHLVEEGAGLIPIKSHGAALF
jgi:hypothetical protein